MTLDMTTTEYVPIKEKGQPIVYQGPMSSNGRLWRAFIAAGTAFFGSLIGISVAGILFSPQTAVVAGGVAAGVAFFGSLTASMRGLAS